MQVGQFSAYHDDVKQGFWPTLVDRISYGYLHALGDMAGRLPPQLARLDVLRNTSACSV